MPITFHNADVKFSLKQKKKLKDFIHHQITKSSNHQIGSLSFVFCSDEYLRDINKKFLSHDYYTDIITFPLSEHEQSLEGEIYISIERVKENSLQFAVRSPQLKDKKSDPPARRAGIRNQKSKIEEGFRAELNRVMFHGILHLLGYKDKTKTQKVEMRKMEDKWLKKFNKLTSK